VFVTVTPTQHVFVPTLTPPPTETPGPTETATPEPAPLDFSGKGDKTLDISSWPHTPGLIFYEGGANTGYFAIVPYGNNQMMPAICNVNSKISYKGVCPINLNGEYSARLLIKATGDWRIKVNPFSHVKTVSVPGSVEGEGNDVFVLTGGVPEAATIMTKTENQGPVFSLVPYKADGTKMISLVNSGDPAYHGTVKVPKEASLIEVSSAGKWSIAISGK
jgi:hypothetical protein